MVVLLWPGRDQVRGHANNTPQPARRNRPHRPTVQYTWPGSNWRPSACEADVIATRPQVLELFCQRHSDRTRTKRPRKRLDKDRGARSNENEKQRKAACPGKGTWCSGITPAQHAGGPGFNPQCVHIDSAQTKANSKTTRRRQR
jgi:hypothetical protein